MTTISIALPERRASPMPAGPARLLRRLAALRRHLHYPRARRQHGLALVDWAASLHRQMR